MTNFAQTVSSKHSRPTMWCFFIYADGWKYGWHFHTEVLKPAVVLKLNVYNDWKFNIFITSFEKNNDAIIMLIYHIYTRINFKTSTVYTYYMYSYIMWKTHRLKLRANRKYKFNYFYNDKHYIVIVMNYIFYNDMIYSYSQSNTSWKHSIKCFNQYSLSLFNVEAYWYLFKSLNVLKFSFLSI